MSSSSSLPSTYHRAWEGVGGWRLPVVSICRGVHVSVCMCRVWPRAITLFGQRLLVCAALEVAVHARWIVTAVCFEVACIASCDLSSKGLQWKAHHAVGRCT